MYKSESNDIYNVTVTVHTAGRNEEHAEEDILPK